MGNWWETAPAIEPTPASLSPSVAAATLPPLAGPKGSSAMNVALAKEEQAREKARVDERYKRRVQAEAQKSARAAASRDVAAGKASGASPSDDKRKE